MFPGGRCESMELDNKILGLIESEYFNPRGVSLGADVESQKSLFCEGKENFLLFLNTPFSGTVTEKNGKGRVPESFPVRRFLDD